MESKNSQIVKKCQSDIKFNEYDMTGSSYYWISE